MRQMIYFVLLITLFSSANSFANPLQMSQFPGRFNLMVSPNPEIYWKWGETPSANQKDYFGLIKIKATSEEVFRKDFSSHLAVSKEGNLSLELSSCKGDVYLNRDLARRSEILEKNNSYIWLNWGMDPQVLVNCLNEFYEVLESNNLNSKYLVKNPYESYQKLAKPVYEKNSKNMEIFQTSNKNILDSFDSGLLIVPDYRHGDQQRYEQLVNILSNTNYDWFGIEMYPAAMQPVIDTYLEAPYGSSEFILAQRKLIDASWIQLDSENPKTPSNKYLVLLDIAKERGLKVYALDSSKQFSLWNHGEVPFGVVARNILWMESSPKTGKGIVFGGSGHFFHYSEKAVNYQDLMSPYFENIFFYQ